MRRVLVIGALALAASACATVGHGHGGDESAGARGWRAWAAGDRAAAERAFAAAVPDDGRAGYGAALMAHDRGDLARAWSLWYQLLAAATHEHKGADAAWWPSLAASAAHELEQLAGEVPGEREQAARLARLDLGRLPWEARRRVVALAGEYARRRGDEAAARAFDRARGCPDRWFVAGSYGMLPRLDLARGYAPERDGDRARLREAQSRGCTVTLEAEEGRSGVLYAVGWFHAERPTDAVAVIEAEGPWRLYVDGEARFDARDEARYPARVQTVGLRLAAGWHHVAVKLAAPGGRADAALALDGDVPLTAWPGNAQGAPPLPPAAAASRRDFVPTLPPPAGDLLADYLAAQAAYRFGDSDAGDEALQRLAERAPRFAPGFLLAAQLAAEDPTRPPRIARDRARRSLERALALDDKLDRARYDLGQMELNAEKPREALERLAGVRSSSWRVPFIRYQALKARGWQREAETALLEARQRNPEACAPLEAEVTLRRERHDVRAALALAREAARCGGGSDELADLLRATGDLDGAIAEYRRLGAIEPTREAWRTGLAEALAQAGRLAEAERVYRELVARYPRAPHFRRALADTLYGLGDAAQARAVITAGLAETPESQDLHRALAALCDGRGDGDGRAAPGHAGRCPGVLDPFRVDGRRVIAEFEHAAEKPRYDTPAVIVLDRTVTRVFATGARLTLTHNIIRVLSKDGIDKFGEVQIPADADVLTLRAVKADGSTREPEEIAGKESVSVPDLEAGDYVELEYAEAAPPPGAFRDGFLAERFYFNSYDAPLDRTEYVVALPAAMPLQIDRRPSARPSGGEVAGRDDVPAPEVSTREGLKVYTWSGRRRAQLFAEPAAAPFAEFVPSVRVGARVSVRAWIDYLRDQQFGDQRANRELRELVMRETRGLGNAADEIAALDGWVRRHIKHGGAIDEAATQILASEEGNRVALLGALLRAAGLPSEMWLVHQRHGAELDGTLPDLEGYDQPLLVAAGLQLDPRYRHAPSGFVSPLLRGGRALRLAADGALETTVDGKNGDERHMDFEVALDADGSAEVRVKERLRGWPALEWREGLEKLTPDRVPPMFEQHTLGFYFPGATLQDLKWHGEDDDGGPFTVEYRFRAPQLARRVGERLVLPAPFPAILGKRYVGTPERRTPLQLDYTAPTELVARIRLPHGAAAAPSLPVKAEAPFGRFEQTVTPTAHGVDLRARFSLADMRLTPARYRELVDFATRVDRAEAKALEIQTAP